MSTGSEALPEAATSRCARAARMGHRRPHRHLHRARSTAAREREVWTWTGANRDIEWVRRRMAQETAVHRWDAAHAVGQPDDLDALVASDGIDEFLTYFANADGANSDVGAAASLGGTVHLHCTDTQGEWFVSKLDADGIDFTREHTKGDVAIRGRASDLLLWLWRRDARPVDIVGDAALAARFQQLSPRWSDRLGVTRQPPIWLIDLPRADEVDLVDPVAGPLRADRGLDRTRRYRRRSRLPRSTSSRSNSSWRTGTCGTGPRR